MSAEGTGLGQGSGVDTGDGSAAAGARSGFRQALTRSGPMGVPMHGLVCALVAGSGALSSGAALAQAPAQAPASAQAPVIVRFAAEDAQLSCAQLREQVLEMERVIEASRPAEPGAASQIGGQVVTNLAGSVGGVMGQMAGSTFGALGSLFGRAAGAAAAGGAAQTAVAGAAAPADPALASRTGQATARIATLNRMAGMKACRAAEPGFAGNALTADQLALLAQEPAMTAPVGAAAARPAPGSFNTAVIADVPPLLPTQGLLSGNLALQGKRIYVSEYRVLFEQAGEIAASTRAGYLFGTNYGGTSVRVAYTAQLDLAALQAVTDRAWADFQARAREAGVVLETPAILDGVAPVYEPTELPSAPGRPVVVNAGAAHGGGARSFIAMAPTGMKLHSRGMAGMGAGDIGSRVTLSKRAVEALAISYGVVLAATESSGSGSSIFRRGSSAQASAAMSLVPAPDTPFAVQSHVLTQALRFNRGLDVPGQFASFRETGGFDSNDSATLAALNQLGRQMGVAANQSKRIDYAVDVDPNAHASLALQAAVSMNQALVEQIAGKR